MHYYAIIALMIGEDKNEDFSIIELNDISRSYGYGDAKSFALKNFSLSVRRGEFIMIMGPSGCGKTTLLNIIGLLDRPTSGNYFLNGKRTQRLSAARQAHLRARKIGFIFQNFNLIPTLPVIENVALPLVYAGYSKTHRLIAASDMLDRFHMHEREYYMPYQLSGGQQQRVAIARSLVSKPEIILADEPTGNLDSRSSHNVMEELRAIHEEGNTIIMVTHNPALTTYATRVIHMLDGQIDTDIKTVSDENLPQSIHVRVSKRRKSAIMEQPEEEPVAEPVEEEPIDEPELGEIEGEEETHELPVLQRPGEKNPEIIASEDGEKTIDALYENNSLTDESSFNDYTTPSPEIKKEEEPIVIVPVPHKEEKPAKKSTKKAANDFPTVGSETQDKSISKRKTRRDLEKEKELLDKKIKMSKRKRAAEASRPPVVMEIPTEKKKGRK